ILYCVPSVGNPIKLALIGFGYWGPNYARVLNDLPGVELTVVCDGSVERLAVVRERYRLVATCSRIDDLWHRDDVDGVVVATPASTHEAIVRAALESERHVLVEKPMALTVGGCEALCCLAASAKRLLMVGYTFLYNAGVLKMKQYMAPEQFGQVYYLHATRTNLGPIRHDVNAMWDLAPHDIAIFNYLLDEQPLWASAIGARVLRTARDDIAFATLGYSNEVVGNIHVSWADPNKVREVVAVGSRRRLVFNDLNDAERVRVFERGVSVGEAMADSYGEFKLLVRDGDIISPKVEPSEPLKNQCQEFVDAIAAGRTPVASGEFGLAVVRTLAAIQASMSARGAVVDV
ncbi:MAG TPA: Gfo/Idh/MocA family oxidoreductase, partial [Gemmatimonadaceae bacterium]|nr:Gfo/Idh/MocA family oxidoreductase [Gemmatimonadaceae bacterium]